MRLAGTMIVVSSSVMAAGPVTVSPVFRSARGTIPACTDPLDTSCFDPYDEDDSVPRFTGLQETYKEWSSAFVEFPPPVRS